MSERDWAAEEAAALRMLLEVNGYRPQDAIDPHDGSMQRKAEEIIAKVLLAAAAVPAGCVRDDKGVDRKVLGTLPVTADNMIAGSAASLWWLDHTTVVQHVSVLPIRVDDCYSTREAALAARGEGKKCAECGIYPPDHPSKTCCGCDAYREHQR